MTVRSKRQAAIAPAIHAGATANGSVDRAATSRLSDVAYKAILQGLFDQKVPAGAFVSQNDLVRQLGIPIQPLRDALRVLEAEGVLTIHPRSGIQFLKPDLELARSTYQFRSIIERAAARRYAETGDANAARQLIADHKALRRRIEKEGVSDDALKALEGLEQRLHGNMIANLQNPLIETTARRLKNYVTLIRLDRLVTTPLALRTLAEHIEILEACVDRAPDRAEAAVAAHFQAALQRILGMF